ncbi:hypothetical protein MTO96_032908 [Rhipicephalus appendiculatus]
MACCLYITVFCFIFLIDQKMGHPYKDELYQLQEGGQQHQQTAFVEERSKRFTCKENGGGCKDKPNCGKRGYVNGTCDGNRPCCKY